MLTCTCFAHIEHIFRVGTVDFSRSARHVLVLVPGPCTRKSLARRLRSYFLGMETTVLALSSFLLVIYLLVGIAQHIQHHETDATPLALPLWPTTRLFPCGRACLRLVELLTILFDSWSMPLHEEEQR